MKGKYSPAARISNQDFLYASLSEYYEKDELYAVLHQGCHGIAVSFLNIRRNYCTYI
jgi:hypothetical protein